MMETIFKILVVAALIGAAIAYFGGSKDKDDAAAGAVAGAFFAGSCLLQCLFYAAALVIGLWLFKLIFS